MIRIQGEGYARWRFSCSLRVHGAKMLAQYIVDILCVD